MAQSETVEINALRWQNALLGIALACAMNRRPSLRRLLSYWARSYWAAVVHKPTEEELADWQTW